VQSGSSTPIRPHVNIDGALRDEVTFVLGDEDEDTDIEIDDDKQDDDVILTASLPAAVKMEHSNEIPAVCDTAKDAPPTEAQVTDSTSSLKYYISRTDTLQGIALRFGLDVGP
jgi:hypothetical protein